MKSTPINFAVLGRKVYKLYPHIAKRLIEQPEFDDLSKIHGMWEYFQTVYTYEKKSKQKIFIWTIVKLFNPDVLIKCRPRLIKGLRIQLAATLKTNPTNISHKLNDTVNYYKLYPNFKTECDKYLKVLTEKFIKY